jgi:hypothetical protein
MRMGGLDISASQKLKKKHLRNKVAVSIVSNTTPVLKKPPIRHHKISISSLQSLENSNLTTPQNTSSPTALQEISLTLDRYLLTQVVYNIPKT